MGNTTNIKGMTKCIVCGREFPLIIEDHYVSKEADKTGFAALAGGLEPLIWDSFDCPHCGCQNRMQQRNRQDSLPECDEDDNTSTCLFHDSVSCCKESCSSNCSFHPEYNPHSVREEKD